jgi:flavin-dependent dehydrogenase
VEPVRGFGGHPGFIKRSTGDGWALVGDAGYFKDPLTAHGITDALRDAELLARAILAGTPAGLANYETTRLDLSQRLFEITDEIASFGWTDDEVQLLHRAFSSEMSREVRALAALDPLTGPIVLLRTPTGGP